MSTDIDYAAPAANPQGTATSTGETLVEVTDLKTHFPIRRGVLS